MTFLQLNDSTDISDYAHLISTVRYIDGCKIKDNSSLSIFICHDLIISLETKYLKLQTNISMSLIYKGSSICIDEAAAMTGKITALFST